MPALPGGLNCALGGFTQQRFELGEDLLDRIEIGTIGRQEEQLELAGADGSRRTALPL